MKERQRKGAGIYRPHPHYAPTSPIHPLYAPILLQYRKWHRLHTQASRDEFNGLVQPYTVYIDIPIPYIIYKGDGPKRSRAAGAISKPGTRGYTIAEGVRVSQWHGYGGVAEKGGGGSARSLYVVCHTHLKPILKTIWNLSWKQVTHLKPVPKSIWSFLSSLVWKQSFNLSWCLKEILQY